MRVMLDTNVLVSMLLFPSEKMNTMMGHIFREHELVQTHWGRILDLLIFADPFNSTTFD
jgi:predicted nucleic acid-binding protein